MSPAEIEDRVETIPAWEPSPAQWEMIEAAERSVAEGRVHAPEDVFARVRARLFAEFGESAR